MGKPRSVLDGCNASNVVTDPFEHLVNDGAFDETHYAALAASFPPMERFFPEGGVSENNQARRIPAALVINDPSYSEVWREFFRYHTSPEFWADIVRVFGPSIRARFPHLEHHAGKPLEQWRSKLRNAAGDAEVSLDALFVINTPVTKRSSVRPTHVDYEDKLVAGLFYMKDELDSTPGGDLSLARFKSGKGEFGGHYARSQDVEEVKRIDYRSNRFITFVNSKASLHGVTPRSPTKSVRRYINFVATTPQGNFSIPSLSPARKFFFWLRRKKAKSKGVTLTQ